MLNCLVVGAGGFVGAVCRYLIGLVPIQENFIFPIKTFGINVLGCILIGLITVMSMKNANISPQVLLFLKVGVCGGFTTFSTFALETSDLMKNGHSGLAFLYVIGSVLIGVSVVFAIEYFGAK